MTTTASTVCASTSRVDRPERRSCPVQPGLKDIRRRRGAGGPGGPSSETARDGNIPRMLRRIALLTLLAISCADDGGSGDTTTTAATTPATTPATTIGDTGSLPTTGDA